MPHKCSDFIYMLSVPCYSAHISLLRRGSLGEGAGKKGEKEARGTTGRKKRGALLSPIFAQSTIEASAEERGAHMLI